MHTKAAPMTMHLIILLYSINISLGFDMGGMPLAYIAIQRTKSHVFVHNLKLPTVNKKLCA